MPVLRRYLTPRWNTPYDNFEAVHLCDGIFFPFTWPGSGAQQANMVQNFINLVRIDNIYINTREEDIRIFQYPVLEKKRVETF